MRWGVVCVAVLLLLVGCCWAFSGDDDQPWLTQAEVAYEEDQPFRLTVHESAKSADARSTITFLGVEEDSRCPVGEVCPPGYVGHYSVRVRCETVGNQTNPEPYVRTLFLSSGDAEGVQVGYFDHWMHRVLLADLNPAPVKGQPIDWSEYVVTLVVEGGLEDHPHEDPDSVVPIFAGHRARLLAGEVGELQETGLMLRVEIGGEGLEHGDVQFGYSENVRGGSHLFTVSQGSTVHFAGGLYALYLEEVYSEDGTHSEHQPLVTFIVRILEANRVPIMVHEDMPFTMALGQTATEFSHDFSLTFLEVTEDSRCPIDTHCSWEGKCGIRVIWHLGEGRHGEVLIDTARRGKPVEIITGPELLDDRFLLSLVGVYPERYTDHSPSPGEYRAALRLHMKPKQQQFALNKPFFIMDGQEARLTDGSLVLHFDGSNYYNEASGVAEVALTWWDTGKEGEKQSFVLGTQSHDTEQSRIGNEYIVVFLHVQAYTTMDETEMHYRLQLLVEEAPHDDDDDDDDFVGCPNRCSGHGHCVGPPTDRACVCDDGFAGEDCGQECWNRCSGNGKCYYDPDESDPHEALFCACDNGYTGDDCSQYTGGVDIPCTQEALELIVTWMWPELQKWGYNFGLQAVHILFRHQYICEEINYVLSHWLAEQLANQYTECPECVGGEGERSSFLQESGYEISPPMYW